MFVEYGLLRLIYRVSLSERSEIFASRMSVEMKDGLSESLEDASRLVQGGWLEHYGLSCTRR